MTVQDAVLVLMFVLERKVLRHLQWKTWKQMQAARRTSTMQLSLIHIYIPPEIIEGANGTWTNDSNDGLSFKSNANFSTFLSVTVDGKVIDVYKRQVAGLVNHPVTVEVPVGITVKDLIDMAGGVSTEEHVLLMGGPMTGRICSQNDIVTKTTKALLVLPPTCPPIEKRQRTIKHNLRNAMSVCSQCSMCTTLCPRNLLGQMCIRDRRNAMLMPC